MFLRFAIAVLFSLGTIQAASLSVLPANTFLAVGQTMSFDISVNSVADLYAFEFDIKVDPMVLEALSISEGAFLGGGGPTLFIPGAIDNVGGFVPFNAGTLEGASGVSGSGVLARFDFLALAVGSTSIDIQNAVLLDSTLAGIAFDMSNGSVTVGAAPEPSFAPLCFVLGAAGVFLGRFRLSAFRR